MPIYEYRCRNGHEFEVFQSMSEDPVSSCRECGAPVERVFHPVAVHFKGSGFYSTDYARDGRSDGAGSADAKKEGAKKDGAKEESGKSDGAKKESGKSETSGKSEKKEGGGEKTKAGSGGD
jgi:putative FmdB family regulatory protein